MRRTASPLGGLSFVAASLLSWSAAAQEGGLSMVFGIDNRLEVTRNPDLTVPAEGTRIANVTALSFGLVSDTALDRLELNASGALIIENPEDAAGTDLDFGRLALDVAYRREVPTALFEIGAQYRQDDVAALGDELSDIDQTGTLTNYGMDARLETGRTAGIGFTVGAGFDVSDYADTTDPDLVDTKRARADTAAILRFSEVLTGRLGLRYQREEEDDLGTTVTQTGTAFAGLDYQASERLDLGAELSFERIETEVADVVTITDGTEGRLSLAYDMPVGTATAELRSTTDADEGRRITFEIGRALEAPGYTLDARLGVTRNDATGTDLTGAIDWVRAGPENRLALGVERSVSYDSDLDAGINRTVFTLSLAQLVSDRGQVSLDLSHALEDSPAERIRQTEVEAVYRHQLTEDWDLAGGVTYRVRDDIDGRAESPGIFLSLSRSFTGSF